MRPFALTHVRLAALLDAHNSHKSNKKFCNKNREMAFSTKMNRLVRVKVDLFYILGCQFVLFLQITFTFYFTEITMGWWMPYTLIGVIWLGKQ